MALNNQIQDIQIFGDSNIVVDWLNSRNNIRVPHLQHLLAELQILKSQFGRISFAHTYKELNLEADTLSKQALAYQPGMLEIEEVIDGLSTLHYETI